MKNRLSTGVIANTMTAVFAFKGARFDGVRSHLACNAQHAPHSGPVQIFPELENVSLFVLRIRMAPHEKTGMHDVSAAGGLATK